MAELVEPTLQRRGFLLRLFHEAGDLTELAGHAGRNDHSDSGATGDHRALEQHRAALGDVGVHWNRGRVFGRGHRLTGERRLVGLQLRRLDQSQVSRDHVPTFEQDHITGNQRMRVDDLDLAIPSNGGPGHPHLAQGLHRAGRSKLGDKSEQCIHAQDNPDCDRLGLLTERDGGRHGDHQQRHQQALELGQ